MTRTGIQLSLPRGKAPPIYLSVEAASEVTERLADLLLELLLLLESAEEEQEDTDAR